MEWQVEFTSEFGAWWNSLTTEEQEDVNASVILLQRMGPLLGYPHSSGVAGSDHAHMRELRIQHAGRPYRVLYAFNPLRTAILLVGGDKTGNDRWYETFVPIADRLYDQHIEELRKEKKLPLEESKASMRLLWLRTSRNYRPRWLRRHVRGASRRPSA